MRDVLTVGSTRRNRGLVSHIAGNEAVVVPVSGRDAGNRSVYTLNESGTMLWAMLEAGRSLAELAHSLQIEYGLAYDEALVDAREFVESLMKEGLVELA